MRVRIVCHQANGIFSRIANFTYFVNTTDLSVWVRFSTGRWVGVVGGIVRYWMGWKVWLGLVVLSCLGLGNPWQMGLGLCAEFNAEGCVSQQDGSLYVTWHRTYGSEDVDYGRDLIPMSDGGVMVVGTRSRNEGGSADVWLLHVGPNGLIKWDQLYGERGSGDYNDEWARAGLRCADGGYAVVATHRVSNVLDGVAASTWLLRLDRNGNQLWNQSYQYFMVDICTDLVECADGGFLLVGFIIYNPFLGPPPSRNEAWVLRTDVHGNVLWNYTLGDYTRNDDMAFAIVECSDGGFAFTGTVYNTVDSQQENDVWLVRIADNGTMLWQSTFGGLGYDSGYNLIECQDRGFALVGAIEDTITNTTDAYLLRTDVNGSLLWDQTFGAAWNDGAYSLVEMTNGDLAITGYFRVNAMDRDLFFWLTDATGNHLYNLTFGGPEDDHGNQLVPKRTGGYFIIGSTVSFGAGESDLWLLLVSDDPPIQDEIPPPLILNFLIGVSIIVIVLLATFGVFFFKRRKI